MENTLRQTDESQLGSCKMEREPDGTLLFQYAQAPAPWKKGLYRVSAMGSYLVAIPMFVIGGVAVGTGKSPSVGIPLIGFAIFIYWFINTWVPRKMLLGSGTLRIVPDVGFKLSNGNLPFKDVHTYTKGYNIHTDSHDICAVTSSGTHPIASCATLDGCTALMISLQSEGAIGNLRPGA